jgi:hypothetical protein
MSISKLLKKLLRFLTLHAVDGEGGGGGEEGSIDDVVDLVGDDEGEGGEGEGNEGSEGGEEGGEGQPDDTHPEDADDPDDPVVTLKVDGHEIKRKQSEINANAQKYEAANRRFEEAANLRKQFEPEQQAVRQERQHLQAALQHYTQILATSLQEGRPNEALIESNPQEYMRQRHAYEARLNQLQQAQDAQNILTQRAQNEQTQQVRARAAAEHGLLLEKLPEWSDPVKAKTGVRAVDEYLANAGFSEPERSSVTDHRVIVIADKARKYDELMAKQAQATGRVKNVPPRVERPGTSTQTRPNEAQAKRARDRFAKDPSINTLADLL